MKTDLAELCADVVVIGAGACGAAATWQLALQGVDVLCIDRGPWHNLAELDRNAPDWELRRRGKHSSNPNIRLAHGGGAWDEPVDDRDSPIKAMIAHGAGGTTPHWSAHVPRFRPCDFTMFSDDGVGLDWPIGYDDLCPYYDRLERQWGTAQVLGDPTLPPREGERFTLPAIGAHGEKIAGLLKAKSWHWWPVDLVVGQDGAAPRNGHCTHGGPCDLGCPGRERSGAERAFLAPAIEMGARFEGGLRVQRLVMGQDGLISHALCRQSHPELGEREVIVKAGRFLLAGGGMGTPRLLLLSALANSSGQVGRNLMLHPYAKIDGLFDAPQGGWIPQTTAGLISLEFFHTDKSRGFDRGMKIQLSPGPGPMALARGAITGQALPWGEAHHNAMEQHFDHMIGFTVCADDLPEYSNYIGLSDTIFDRDGLPAAAWHYRVSENSRRILDYGLARAGEILRDAGARETFITPLRDQAGFHIMGTARMGKDPQYSVVDPMGRSHDINNLFIADPSVFVTASSINPTATAQAFALRTAELIAADVKFYSTI